MQRKKVVFIVKYFYPIKRPSGISSFVYELAKEIAKDVDLFVISYKKEKDNKKEYRHNDYTIFKVEKPFPLTASKLANKINPDVVIIFSGIFEPFKTMLYFGLISCLLKTKKKIFCQATNYNKEILPKLYKIYLKYFSDIIALNEYIFKQYQNLGIKAVLITPGVNFSALDQLSLRKIVKNREVRIGFFGHFYHLKGPDRLLEVFLKINPKNAELIFAGGDGPLKTKISEKAKKDSRISIIGWQETIIPYIASCDIVVLPYRNSYSVLGVSQAALEAMALYVPVIGTKTPSLEFLIKDGYNGYIVGNDGELKEKLQYLIEHPKKRAELAENARQTIINRFDINRIAKDYLSLIYEYR